MDQLTDAVRAGMAALTYDHPERGSSRVADFVLMDDGTVYAAVARTHGPWSKVRPGETSVMAVAIHPQPDGGNVRPFTLAPEWRGHPDHRCPARILDQLTAVETFAAPLRDGGEGEYESAVRWREACRARLTGGAGCA